MRNLLRSVILIFGLATLTNTATAQRSDMKIGLNLTSLINEKLEVSLEKPMFNRISADLRLMYINHVWGDRNSKWYEAQLGVKLYLDQTNGDWDIYVEPNIGLAILENTDVEDEYARWGVVPNIGIGTGVKKRINDRITLDLYCKANLFNPSRKLKAGGLERNFYRMYLPEPGVRICYQL